MRVYLALTKGPNAGLVIPFDGHETFVVGRSSRTSVRLPVKDRYLSRFHFLLEINVPRVRLVDLHSNNGTFVNGQRVPEPAELRHGDTIRAGRTGFQVRIEPDGQPCPAAWEEAPVQLAFDTGFPTVTGYQIVREIGRGVRGTVYEAVRQADGTTRAVKVVHPAAAPAPEMVERLVQEAEVLRQLDHPGIVRFHDCGECEGRLYFATEFVPGGDGRQRILARGPLVVPAAVRVVVGLLQALGHAHRRGFVHRDVKPSNVLLARREGKKVGVQVADFGLARVYEASNLSGLCVTANREPPVFLPPEQLLDFRSVAPAADLYGAAATLYYLLTAAPIFEVPADRVAAIGLILDGDPVPIRERQPAVPLALAAAIHRCLAKDPADRFATAEAFIEAIAPFLPAALS